MNHPSKCLVCASIIAWTGFGLVGCAKKEEPVAQKQPLGLTPEQKAARDLQKSNEAVTEIGKKIGRKPKPIDLNLPPEQKTEQPPAASPKP
jgi:hypothetical protein